MKNISSDNRKTHFLEDIFKQGQKLSRSTYVKVIMTSNDILVESNFRSPNYLTKFSRKITIMLAYIPSYGKIRF